MSEYLKGLIERAMSPISEEKPCGENARNDTRYDKAKTEIMKMTAGAASIDWKDLLNSIDSLLSEKTKDLTLAAYLCLALLKEHEYPGLLAGMKVIDGFLTNWWEVMFPPVERVKARVQIFEWMDERLSTLISITEPKIENADEIRQCKLIADELPGKVQSLVKTQVTGFSRLKTEINQWVEKLPAPKKEIKEEVKQENVAGHEREKQKEGDRKETPTEAPLIDDFLNETDGTSTTTNSEPAQKSAKKIDLQLPVDELENIDEGLKAITKIVQLLRKVDPLEPIVYRMARVLKWDVVRSSPPAAADGKTRIPPPHQQKITLLDTQLNAGNWPVLTQNAESLFITEGVFFLTLQRYVTQGLLNQGAEEASQVVMVETGKLLNRLPDLMNFSYVSGFPFADDETKSWARDAMKAAAGSGASEEEEDSTWLSEATKAAGKSMAAALPLFKNAINDAKNIKSIMKRQCDVAKFFLNNREYQWAMPLLESLYDRIETVGLAQWDPEFCSDVWELLLRGYEASPKGLDATGKDNSHVLGIRQKLFETNVAKAAGVTPKETKK